MGWTAVPTSALGAQQQIVRPTLNVTQPGYIFVYLSYENESNNYVAFDDFKVTHTPTNDNASNRYLYNGGNELNENSGWYETFFRGYDAALGRFMQVDPLASSFTSYSPYLFANNNPVLYNDILGDSPDDPTDPNKKNRSTSGPTSTDARQPDYYRPINEHRISPGSGNHWSDGSRYSDWSANGGSQTYRDLYTSGATQIAGGQYTYDKNGKLQPISEENGKLYVRCYACGDFEGQSKDWNTLYYYNTYDIIAQQEDPQTWYYMSRDGMPHGMVYDPIGKYIYEINQVPYQSLLGQIERLIINSLSPNFAQAKVSVAYQYRQSNDAEWSSLLEREKGNTYLLSPVTVTNPAAATAWFQGQTGNAWNYSPGANNCTHYSVQFRG